MRVLAVLLLLVGHAIAGGWTSKSPLHLWFDHLSSSKGLCCSFADGIALTDIDWNEGPTGYRVKIDGSWYDVPSAAVVTEPNRFGQAVVWPYTDALGATRIRCFMPGALS